MSAMPSLAIFVLYHMLQVTSDHHCDQGRPAAPHDVVLHLSKNLANFTPNVCVQIIDCEWVVGKTSILEVPSQEEVRRVEIR